MTKMFRCLVTCWYRHYIPYQLPWYCYQRSLFGGQCAGLSFNPPMFSFKNLLLGKTIGYEAIIVYLSWFKPHILPINFTSLQQFLMNFDSWYKVKWKTRICEELGLGLDIKCAKTPRLLDSKRLSVITYTRWPVLWSREAIGRRVSGMS